ncbi:histamine N-methyltransferase-like [Saccoglossus kowalevskii]
MNYGMKGRELRYKEDAKKTIDKLQLASYNEIYILSIGASNGDADQHFINALVDKYTAIHYTVVEPATGPLDDFKRLIESNQERWSGVKFSFHVQGINEYLEGGGTSDKYDVILACHSAYHFHDVVNTLCCLYDMLPQNGMLFIRIETDGGLEVYFEHSEQLDIPLYFIPGKEIKRLIQLHMPATKIDVITGATTVNVTRCFDKDSIYGNNILDFMNQIVDVRHSRPPDEVEKCLKFFREQCCYEKGDDVLFDYIDEDIIIWKK